MKSNIPIAGYRKMTSKIVYGIVAMSPSKQSLRPLLNNKVKPV